MTEVATQTQLIDRFGRRVNYVRMSITDRCDFRCVYCMDEEMVFMPRQQLLSLEEIVSLVGAFAELGVEKVRVTGGEPLVRKNVDWLFKELGDLKKTLENATEEIKKEIELRNIPDITTQIEFKEDNNA